MNELGNTPADKDYKPSGISRAEERALEFYPMKDYNKEPNYIHSCDSKMLDEVYRDVFRIGYEAAEKDLALTWEDIKTINQILWDLHYEGWPCESEIQDEARFREALKRFKEARQ